MNGLSLPEAFLPLPVQLVWLWLLLSLSTTLL